MNEKEKKIMNEKNLKWYNSLKEKQWLREVERENENRTITVNAQDDNSTISVDDFDNNKAETEVEAKEREKKENEDKLFEISKNITFNRGNLDFILNYINSFQDFIEMVEKRNRCVEPLGNIISPNYSDFPTSSDTSESNPSSKAVSPEEVFKRLKDRVEDFEKAKEKNDLLVAEIFKYVITTK